MYLVSNKKQVRQRLYGEHMQVPHLCRSLKARFKLTVIQYFH